MLQLGCAGAEGSPAACCHLVALALDGTQRAAQQLQVSCGVVIQHVVVTQVAEHIQFVYLQGQRVALLLQEKNKYTTSVKKNNVNKNNV